MKIKPLTRSEVASLLAFVYGADHLNDEMASVETLVANLGNVKVWVSPSGAYHVGSGAPDTWTAIAIITQQSINT